jgi:hypothetical protein
MGDVQVRGTERGALMEAGRIPEFGHRIVMKLTSSPRASENRRFFRLARVEDAGVAFHHRASLRGVRIPGAACRVDPVRRVRYPRDRASQTPMEVPDDVRREQAVPKV